MNPMYYNSGWTQLVMINGLYYDNMYGTLFGAATRPAYTIEHKIKVLEKEYGE